MLVFYAALLYVGQKGVFSQLADILFLVTGQQALCL